MSGDREKTAGQAAVEKVLRREDVAEVQPTPDPGSGAARPSIVEAQGPAAHHAGSRAPKVLAGLVVLGAVAALLLHRRAG